MKIHVIIFGQLTDITGKSDIWLDDIPDSDSLIHSMQKMYPALADAKYAIALDKKVINENTMLWDNITAAFLPPFSGG